MRYPCLLTPMFSHYRLQVIRAEGIQWKSSWRGEAPSLYVKVTLGSSAKKTRVIKKCASPVWDETLVFSTSDGSPTFEIELKHQSRGPSNPCVGASEIRLVDLLAKSASGEVSIVLDIASSGHNAAATTSSSVIILRLGVCDAMSAAQASIDGASEEVRRSKIRCLGGVSDVTERGDAVTHSENQSDLYKTVGELLLRLDVFKRIADTLSEIHPFITIAWKSASILYSAVRSTFETDKRVVELVQAMADAFAFVDDVQTLREKSTRLLESISGLLKQIMECCLFVRQYVGRTFLKRMLDLRSIQKVDDFERALASFKQQIDSGVVHHTAFVSMRTSERLNDLSLLQRLNPSMMDGFHRSECLPGTRTEIRARIIEWIFSETKENIFWLHGVAGSGKSTVSSTIANELRGMSRLGAYLFFERGKSEPSSVIRTMAYKLALFDSSIGSSILSEIENDKDIATACPQHQFDKLLLEPLRSVANSVSEPIVIVLDALDECGTPESRRRLLELLQAGFAKLPGNFRFLITSRQEPDITRALSSRPEAVRAAGLDYTSETSRNDVSLYLRTEMRKVVEEQVKIPGDWPWEDNISRLCVTAGGLFIWASTALKMVGNSDNPFDRLESLVTNSASLTGFGLDELYGTVLKNSGISWDDARSRGRFKKVLSLLLVSKAPLTSKAIDGILGFAPREPSLLILSKLRSLVTYSQGAPVSLLHTSFSDYLISPDRVDEPWFINMGEAEHHVAARCFTVMEDLLRFNICDLETSFIRNNDIGGLENQVKARIPSHLEYACIYWTQHLLAVSYPTDLREKLLNFAHYRLLFWFEVLSLVKVFGRVAFSALLEAASWCDSHDTDIATFLRDASKFATIFALPIVQSMPHIYVSMIPLALSGSDSIVAKHYSKSMSSLVGVESKGSKGPTLWLKVLEVHSDVVCCVAFSPNSRYVASASRDETARVWDIDSGEEICMPLTGHTSFVTSVCFSPDGSRVVSGSWDSTLRVWDVQTGHLILSPLEGHSGRVDAVAWSPDGSVIASGSRDNTIIIWDAANGKAICRLEGHIDGVTSVAFSSDGSRLASGSLDGTIRVWDAKSGELAFGPFECDSRDVSSVVFSPDGTHVASGCNEETIDIWEIESGCVISNLEGHTSNVMSVAYSPCGTRIVSGSDDKTIKVWDVKSGKIVSILDGHTHEVYSVTFSPDGKYIASGSHDKTVRIWDATATNDNSESSTKHSNYANSVVISPDGGRIASASSDGTIIVWDAQTGNAVLGPLIGHTGCVTSVAFSPNGSRLFSGSRDKMIRIWDAETGEPVSVQPLHSNVYCIAVSPDGNTVVSGSYDGTISVWCIATGELASIGGHSKCVWSLAFSSNGKHLASSSDDSTIKIWNTENWEAIHDPLIGHTHTVYSVCFSSDGRLLVSGSRDNTIIVWGVAEHRRVVGPLKGHNNSVISVLFSHDGRHVISGSWDETIRIWNLESLQTICKLDGHTDSVMTIALTPDGRRIVSGSLDRTIRAWDLSDILVPSKEDTDSCSLTSSSPPHFSNWILGENGWVLGGPDQRDLLLWIPPDLRTTLCRSRNTAVLNCGFSTKLDFSGAALGGNWVNCFRNTG